MCGSFLIVEGSRSEVEAFAEADPYRTAGLFRNSSIDEWVWAVSRLYTRVIERERGSSSHRHRQDCAQTDTMNKNA
jgi:hypothetical protein